MRSFLLRLFQNAFRLFTEQNGAPLLTIFLSFLPLALSGQSGSFTISNPSALTRKSELIVLSRESLKALMEIPVGKLPSIYIDGRSIPSQTDDLTRDGLWDELVFQVDVERNSNIQVKVKWLNSAEAPVFKQLVRCHLGVKEAGANSFQKVENEILPDDWQAGKEPLRYQNEGPIWESEQIAFRHLFDERNFSTVLGKRVPGLFGDTLKISKGPEGEDSKWGKEVLPFDSGFGAGGFSIKLNGRWHTPGKTGTVQFKLLANGPVRAVFDLLYEDWMVEEMSLNVRKRISIMAGKSYYKTELQVSGFPGELELAAGISLPSDAGVPVRMSLRQDCFGAYWIRQQENEKSGSVGMGILIFSAGVNGFSESDKKGNEPVFHSCSGLCRISSGQAVDYLSFAAWDKALEGLSSGMNLRNLIQKEADLMEYPLKVSQ